jgi:NADPH:quinone reductase-like Zn-dependent oxidoreductase
MTMHAMRIHEFGGPETLKDDVLPLPQPRDDEVLVRIEAASVNPVDGKTRQGKFPPVQEDALPLTLGRDLSGVVESCGTQVHGLRKGDAVFAFLGTDRGAYAQYAMVKAAEFAPKPENLSHVEAASVPLAALTAWQGMIDHGGLKKGQRVLIHGAAGGVGHFAVQIAEARGAWVAATCSRDDMDFVRGLGADQVIDYKNQKFEKEVSDIDLVFDLVAGETQDRSFAVLKDGGALVSTLQEPDQEKARAKHLRTAHYMTRPDAEQLAEIGDLLLMGEIKPYIFATYPLEEAARAETALAKDHVQGKIVLTVNLGQGIRPAR